MTINQPDKSDRIELLLEQMAVNIKQIGTDVQQLQVEVVQLKEVVSDQGAKLEKETARWDERFFAFAKDNLQTSRTIILTAGAAIILAPLVQAVSPVIGELGNQLLHYWFKV